MKTFLVSDADSVALDSASLAVGPPTGSPAIIGVAE